MNKKLKILALASWYPNEMDPQKGIFIEHQLEAISTQHEITLVQLKPGSKFQITESTSSNFNTVSISYNATYNFLRPIYWIMAWAKSLSYMKEHKFDFIHLHVIFPVGIVALWYSKKMNLPLITTEHWSGYRRKEEYNGFFRKWISHKVVELSRAIVVQSTFLKSLLEKQNLHGKFYIVPNIVKFGNSELSVSYEKNIVSILNVADHVDSDKNISGLLHSFSLALKTNPHLRLVQIGSGPDSIYLKKLCSELKLENHVTWLGRLKNEEVLHKISDCNFGIINSNVETFSVVAFEFLAVNKPIVITRCGGPEEYLPNNFGILNSINNDEELSLSIIKMANSYMNYNLDVCSEEVRNNFSSEQFLKRINEVYSKVNT